MSVPLWDVRGTLLPLLAAVGVYARDRNGERRLRDVPGVVSTHGFLFFCSIWELGRNLSTIICQTDSPTCQLQGQEACE
jgi:hypothetical protein